MIYVKREAGVIVGVFGCPQPQEDGSLLNDPVPVEEDHPDVLTFKRPTQRQEILKQLADIDKATGSVRWVRELALGVKLAWDKQREIQPDLPTAGTGMAKVQQIEDQCKALRTQLSALP